MATFQVFPRESSVKAKKLRQQGLVPIALIDRNHQPTLVQASLLELRRAVARADSHGTVEIQLQGEKQTRKAMVRNIEHDALKHQVLSVTLQEVADDDMLKLDVPIVAIGTPRALEEGSNVMLETPTDHVKLKGKVVELPDHLEVDVTGLGLGEHISASDLQLPSGVELLSPPDAVLFSCKVVREVSEEPATAVPEGYTDEDAGSDGVGTE